MPNQRRSEEKEESNKELTAAEESLVAEIEEIYALMVEQGLTQLTVEKKENKLFLRRGIKTESAVHHRRIAPLAAPVEEKKEQDLNCLPVKSPLIGVFYNASSPESKPFVEVGSTVEKGAALCIVEAMKVMNEIPSPVRGKVIKILSSNGKSVQAEQDLFLLQPLEE
ncbi:MAG: biotin/lipoyl-containing protein [Elusimicrobiota bacterium]